MTLPGATSRGGGVRLGTVLGAPLSVSAWWFVAALFITLVFAPGYRSSRPDLPDGSEYLLAATLVLLLYLSVFLHELGHAVAARAFGIPVVRVRLDVLGGFTEMSRAAGTPGREAVVAGAGPAVSVLITLVAGTGWALLPDGSLAALLVGQLTVVNLLVSAFNLLPGLPLDGGSVLRSLVWAVTGRRHLATVTAAWAGRVVAVVTAVLPLVVAWWLGGRPSLLAAFWFLVLAVSIWGGSSAALAQAHLARAVGDLHLGGLLRRVTLVPPDEPLTEVVRRAGADGAAAVVVVAAGRPVGLVSEEAVVATPAERRGAVTAGTVARRLGPSDLLPVDLSGPALLDVLAARPAREHVVVGPAGEVRGVVRSEDVEVVLARRRD